LYSPRRTNATAVEAEKTGRRRAWRDLGVMIVKRTAFLELLASEPKLALAIMATLTRRLRDLQAAATL
jgi:CRP-like cAMP-binding protein